MDELKNDLITRGLDFSILPKEVQTLVARTSDTYRKLPADRRPEFVEKFIDILADAENNLAQLSTEVGLKKYVIQTEDTAGMIENHIESKEAYEIRKNLYEMAGIDSNPSRNGLASQVLMAVIDEFVVSLGDMAVEIYKTWDTKGGLYILSEIKNTVLSGDTWALIMKELSGGLSSMVFDWDTGTDDFIYKKTRSLLIATGLAMLMKSVGKKIIKTIAKRTIRSTAVAATATVSANQ